MVTTRPRNHSGISKSGMLSRTTDKTIANGLTIFFVALPSNARTPSPVARRPSPVARRPSPVARRPSPVAVLCKSNGCVLRLTAVAAVCIEVRDATFITYRDILDILLHWQADCRSAIVCVTHGGSEMPCGCLHGQTPLQVSQNHAFDDPRADGQFAERIRRRLSCKRERRATPVKERAVKVGVVLPPTPSGVREATKSGTPVAQREARRKLQRHQQACQQRVASAEEKADVGCSVSGVAARHRALHAANQARHHARKKQCAREEPKSPCLL